MYDFTVDWQLLMLTVLSFSALNTTLATEESQSAQIFAEILRIQNTIESVELVYTAKTKNTNPVDPYSYIKTHYAAKGINRFRETLHWSTRRESSLDQNHLRQIYTGKQFNVFYIPSRVYEVGSTSPDDEPPWKLRIDRILDCLGWWPEQDQQPPTNDDSISRYLRFACVSEHYRLEANEIIDGERCHVLTSPGRDKIWIAPEKGYAIVKRHIYDRITGKLLRSQHSKDFRKLSAGEGSPQIALWYPRNISIETYLDNNQDEDFGKSVEISIDELRINQVEDRLFAFTPPPGTITTNRDTGEVKVIPGGMELLDETISVSDTILNLAPEKRITSASSSLRIPTLAFAVIGIVVPLTGYLLLRTKRLESKQIPQTLLTSQ